MIKNFKTIADNCIKGKICGKFVLGSGIEITSDVLDYNRNTETNKKYPYAFYGGYNIELTRNGKNHYYSHTASIFDVVEFKKLVV